jgi:MGT family glycosyltransferase
VRVAYFHLPVAGHVNPTLPVMAELRRRGVSVFAYATPSIAAPVAETGVQVLLYPAELESRLAAPPRGIAPVAALLAEQIVYLLPFALRELERAPVDVVVCDSMAPWGRLAAEIAGVPCVTSSAIFSVHAGMVDGPRAAAAGIADIVSGAGALRRLARTRRRIRRRWGVDPGGPLRLLSNRADRTVVFTSRALQPGADRIAGDVRYVGIALRDPGPPDPLLLELGDEPVIYIALGTLFNDRPDFLRACLAAFAGESGRVLISTGARLDPRALGPLPANAMVRRSVPQLQVLARTRLFVTHGGINSVSEALAYGVPMVFYPQTADQPIIARRVAGLGAGRVLRGRHPAPAQVARAAAAVLDDRCAARAAKLGATLLEGGGATAAADAIVGACAITG